VLRIAVIDSTPLINLVHLELADELGLFFDTIYVPAAVQREVNKKQRFRYRLQKLYRRGPFEGCASADQTSVQLLQAELDPGEAEGLIQAQERRARYFIGDDKGARDTSVGYGLTPVGTARLLARLHLEGQADDPTALVRKLRRDLDFRITPQVLDDAIALAPKPI
jgi:predicted nucleic acid-binding protein